MAHVPLRSPSEKVGGLFYFGRMLDKIRLHAREELPSDYHENLGKGFDKKCVKFLRVGYDELVACVKQGGTDEEILDWCFTVGRKPNADDIYVWNEFMRKRGWNDEVSEMVRVESTRRAVRRRSVPSLPYYSSRVSIRSARLKSSSVKPPLLCVESTKQTLLYRMSMSG
jgi:hypothetical protein